MFKEFTLAIIFISVVLGVPLYSTTGETAFFATRGIDHITGLPITPTAFCDDCCTDPIPTSGPFEFFGDSYTSFTVSMNGVVAFGSDCQVEYTPKPFPATDYPVLAPYWADVDNRGTNSGSPSYKVVSGKSPIDSLVGFDSVEWFQVSWVNVGYYEAHDNILNTFQVVVATDREKTAACFQYPTPEELNNSQGGLDWTTGDVSFVAPNPPPVGGFGGIPAQVGFDAGDNSHYFAHPDSFTSSICNIDGSGSAEQYSTHGVTGQFCYLISNPVIVEIDSTNESTLSPTTDQIVIDTTSNSPALFSGFLLGSIIFVCLLA